MSCAVSMRLAVRAPDGRVTRLVRLVWAEPPTAGQLLAEVAERLIDARRRGENVTVESAPAAVRTVLAVAGLLGTGQLGTGQLGTGQLGSGQGNESGRPSSANTGAPRK